MAAQCLDSCLVEAARKLLIQRISTNCLNLYYTSYFIVLFIIVDCVPATKSTCLSLSWTSQPSVSDADLCALPSSSKEGISHFLEDDT